MIKIDKDILEDLQKHIPNIKRHEIKQHLFHVHPNGFPSFIILYEGTWDTTSCHTLKRIFLDDKGNRVDDCIEYGRGDNDVWDFQDDGRLNTLQDEIELFSIRALRFATEEQNHQIRLFRYKWRGLLDRIPPMLDVIDLIPQESSTECTNLHYELRSQEQENIFFDKYNKFLSLAEQLYKERFPPINCPPLRVVKNWNKPIYVLAHKYCNVMKDEDWADTEQLNVHKYLALKYTFKGEWKSPQDIQNSYSSAKHRTSTIVK